MHSRIRELKRSTGISGLLLEHMILRGSCSKVLNKSISVEVLFLPDKFMPWDESSDAKVDSNVRCVMITDLKRRKGISVSYLVRYIRDYMVNEG